MKKNFKLVLALVLSVMMIVGNMAVLADVDPASDAHLPVDSSSYDNLLTVSGLASGDVVNFYKIIEWVGSQSGNVQGWKAISPYDQAFTSPDTLEAVLGANNVPPRGIGATLAQKLATLSQNQTAVDTVNVGSDGKATLDTSAATAPGIYMAIVTPYDKDTIYNPVFVSSDFNTSNGSASWAVTSGTTYASTDASVKKTTTKLEKTAQADDDKWDQSYSADAVAIGDTVHYTVTTTIPAYKGYEYPSFVLKDKLTDLKLVYTDATTNSIVVSPNTVRYTVTAIADNGYTITISPEYLKTLSAPQPITVTYDAIVTTEALKNVNMELNEVSTEFSNNPQNSSSFDVKKDDTKHYTFSIDANALFGYGMSSGERGSEIIKVGLDADGNPITSEEVHSTITDTNYVTGPLENAEFRLYTDAACQNEYEPKKPDGSAGTAQLYKSDAHGYINIKGLDAGTYYLLETKAPDGFIKSNSPVKIEIECQWTNPETEVTEYFDVDTKEWKMQRTKDTDKPYTYKVKELAGYTIKINGVATTHHEFTHTSASSEPIWNDQGSTELPSSIPNVKGVELPSTGGIGTTIFYVGGSLLVLAAAILLITKRRMGSND